MLFLANENFPLTSIRRLRDEGHNVVAISEDAPGSTDRAVLDRAAQEHRIILTFDRDYGELIYRQKLPIPVGVVYFRLIPTTPVEPAMHVLQLLNIAEMTLEGMFTIVERSHIRQRPLP